jgi:hypothetical protein
MPARKNKSGRLITYLLGTQPTQCRSDRKECLNHLDPETMTERNDYYSEREKHREENERERREKEQERLEEDQRFKADQTNNNISDPTAKRNIGLGGAQQRDDDKGQLHNLKIEGNEVSGYGDTDHDDENAAHGGPGFKAEGGEYASPPIRNNDQVAD